MDDRTVRYTNREDPARYYGVELSRDGATFVAGGDVLVGAADGWNGGDVVRDNYDLTAAGLDRASVDRLIDDLARDIPGRHVWYDGKPKGSRIIDLPYRDEPEKTPINVADPAYPAALEAVSRRLGHRSDHPVMALGALPFQWDD